MSNILVIDDEPLLLDLISDTLRLDGHNVTAMGDPVSALRSRGAGQLTIDLLVTDVTTKPISGIELVNLMRSSGFAGPVVFMSGYPAPSEDAPEYLPGCAYLEKPFTASELRAAVAAAVPGARTRAHSGSKDA